MKLNKIMNNFRKLELLSYDIFFSYETPIAIIGENNAYVTKNEWGLTTGNHINWVKSNYDIAQIPHEDLVDIIKVTF